MLAKTKRRKPKPKSKKPVTVGTLLRLIGDMPNELPEHRTKKRTP